MDISKLLQSFDAAQRNPACDDRARHENIKQGLTTRLAAVFCASLNAFITKLLRRIDAAQYALACDDEACIHYKITPSPWFRFGLAFRAFFNLKA